MEPLRRCWEINPWSRTGFGAQYVVDPTGEVMLSTGPSKPFHDSDQGRLFVLSLETALERFERIQANQAELARLREEIDLEWRSKHRNAFDPDVRTKEIFQHGRFVNERFTGVFQSAEPRVRQQAAELLGRYVQAEGDEGFRPGGRWERFGAAVASLLHDESPDVRRAATVCMFQLFDEPVPERGSDDRNAAAAAARWSAAASARAGR